MADLVVKDLAGLVSDLKELVHQFAGALDFQNDQKGQWGQRNANWSMGDFADNWTGSRDKMVKAMEEFSAKIDEVDKAWTEAERSLVESMEKK